MDKKIEERKKIKSKIFLVNMTIRYSNKINSTLQYFESCVFNNKLR